MATELDDVAARALCSIVLERTADALADGGKGAENALVALASDTGLMLDIAAGLLYATTFIAGAGDVPAGDIFAASMAMKPDDDEAIDTEADPAPVEALPPPHGEPAGDAIAITSLSPDDAGKSCAWCDCSPIGRVNDRRVCMFHVDPHDEDTVCPSCRVKMPEGDDGGEEE